MKRKLGAFLTLIGILLFFYTLFSLLKNSKKPISPVPLKEGIKVIQLSPTP